MLTLGSLFDGIGGWLLAARHAGVKPVWASEIEKFPCAVTATRFPDVAQLGDITKLDGAEIPPVDIVCGSGKRSTHGWGQAETKCLLSMPNGGTSLNLPSCGYRNPCDALPRQSAKDFKACRTDTR